MAFCRNCGTQLSEGAKFCPKCGTSISPVTNDNSGKSLSKRIVIPLIVSILILAIAGVGWYLWKNQSEDYSLEGLAAVVVDFDEVQEFHEGLAGFKKGNKWGVIDKKGNVVVEPTYESYGICFQEGMAAVSKDGKYGFINSVGELVVSFSYDDARPFSNGCAAVKKGEKWGFVNKKGLLIIPCKYEYIQDFSEGYANVEENGKWGFIDQSNNVVIPFKYSSALGRFSEGLAPFYGDNNNGYINYSGYESIIIDSKYYRIGDFHDGLACVESENGCGFIDKTGKVVIPEIYFSYRGYWSDFQDGYAIVYSEKENGMGVIDKSGKVVIPFKDCFISYSDGIFHVMENDKNDFYDTNGKCILSSNYEIGDFSEGLAVVIKNGIYGFIDKKGNSTFDVDNPEVKQMVQNKIKEIEAKKREEERKLEEERKRIEEENKPYNKFKSFISQKSFVWEGPSAESEHVEVLYFYPLNSSMGQVSLVTFKNTFTSYSMRWSGSGTYSIVDDIVDFYIEWKMTNSNYELRGKRIVLRIENYGDNVKLVDVKSNRTYLPKMATVNNPLRK